MKAVYIKEFGGAENLELREVSDPAPPKGPEVLVRVHSAGLNRADILQRRGLYPAPTGYSQHIPGMEFAGVVEEVGENVTDWRAGDRVFGIVAGEAQAEYLVTQATLLALVPANIDIAGAGGIPEAFITAHDALFTQAGLLKDETVLIHAVGSGVGLAGFQLAMAAGARVIGTSRTQEKLDKCIGLELGIAVTDARFADRVLELTEGKGVDVILDLVGAAYFDENLKCIASKGRLMLVGLTSGSRVEFDLRTTLSKRLTIRGTILRGRSLAEKAEATKHFVSDVVPLFESGDLRPNIDRMFTAKDVADAHRFMESNENFGKVVLAF